MLVIEVRREPLVGNNGCCLGKIAALSPQLPSADLSSCSDTSWQPAEVSLALPFIRGYLSLS